MNSTTTSSLAKSVLGNPLLSSLLLLAVLGAGVMTGSSTLLIASGLLAFARPILYAAVLNAEDKSESAIEKKYVERSTFDRRSSNRPSAYGAF
jgi:hypothetical protein